MALQNGDHHLSSEDMLQAQSHIWNHTFSFIRSMSLKCAIQLQIPDIIDRHGAPMLLTELVEALHINKDRAHCVYRLMRILINSGFFVKQSMRTTENGIYYEEREEGYLLAPASRMLLKDDPFSVTPFLLAMLDPIFMDPWQQLSKWFQDDVATTAFQTAHGRPIWDLASQDPKLNDYINGTMASDARVVSSVMLKHCPGVFQGLHSIVDVGGGTGTVAKAIAEAFPDISCINFDLPHVVKGLEGSKNLSYVCGNMFEAIPKADAVLLKWILHDWNDEECIKILKRCKEAMSRENGGKLIIIETVVKDEDDYKSLETRLFLDMVMMVCVTGKERSEEEWAKLFFDVCLTYYKITPIIGLCILVAILSLNTFFCATDKFLGLKILLEYD